MHDAMMSSTGLLTGCLMMKHDKIGTQTSYPLEYRRSSWHGRRIDEHVRGHWPLQRHILVVVVSETERDVRLVLYLVFAFAHRTR